MIEEEAFLWKILDSPQDDLPRMIYSDWLEERYDSRGKFLRAELDWAKPWKDGQVPAEPTRLSLLATSHDPLWVARVCRPPLGVCLEHVSVKVSGNALSLTDLESLQLRLGVNFGVELIAMLLNRNGGRPRANIYKSPRFGDGDSIHWFLPATTVSLPPSTTPGARNSSIESFWNVILSYAAHAPMSGERAFLPIAFGAEMGLFALGLTATRLGKIYRFATGNHGMLKAPKLCDESLPDFLANITKFVRPDYTDT